MTLFNESVRCMLTPADTFNLRKELLAPNTNILYGLDAADGYDNYMPKLVSDTLGFIGSEHALGQNPLFKENIPLTIQSRKVTISLIINL